MTYANANAIFSQLTVLSDGIPQPALVVPAWDFTGQFFGPAVFGGGAAEFSDEVVIAGADGTGTSAYLGGAYGTTDVLVGGDGGDRLLAIGDGGDVLFFGGDGSDLLGLNDRSREASTVWADFGDTDEVWLSPFFFRNIAEERGDGKIVVRFGPATVVTAENDFGGSATLLAEQEGVGILGRLLGDPYVDRPPAPLPLPKVEVFDFGFAYGEPKTYLVDSGDVVFRLAPDDGIAVDLDGIAVEEINLVAGGGEGVVKISLEEGDDIVLLYEDFGEDRIDDPVDLAAIVSEYVWL